ncbi:Zinc finger CCHC-type [Carpediemonas membranifera]|uniref:Zinc finger CCHC-type n=1 Tax=Carpediemonas membranifera TaxID=201153 RepID=A0A8J6B6Z4_9EUKA|nr:Zinc finger CCHC-type [Carpediemonas membranifera]|eukprot:KAG9395584.1 Zinc finger CCHC-type [Carpediemonas membranifera]
MLEVWALFGKPALLQTDGGPEFRNQVDAEVNRILSLKHRYSTPHHPASNGIVERTNGKVLRLLRGLLFDSQDYDWVPFLPLVQYIINTRPTRATGQAPLRLVTGNSGSDSKQFSVAQYERVWALFKEMSAGQADCLKAFRDALTTRRLQAKAHLQRYSERNKSGEDSDTPPSFPDGSFALLRYVGRAPKLLTSLRGPMKVVRAGESPATHVVRDLVSLAEVLVSDERLIPVETPEDEQALIARLAAECGEYVVDNVYKHRVSNKGSKVEFKVHWLGYEPSEDSWISFTRDTDQLEALD